MKPSAAACDAQLIRPAAASAAFKIRNLMKSPIRRARAVRNGRATEDPRSRLVLVQGIHLCREVLAPHAKFAPKNYRGKGCGGAWETSIHFASNYSNTTFHRLGTVETQGAVLAKAASVDVIYSRRWPLGPFAVVKAVRTESTTPSAGRRFRRWGWRGAPRRCGSGGGRR